MLRSIGVKRDKYNHDKAGTTAGSNAWDANLVDPRRLRGQDSNGNRERLARMQQTTAAGLLLPQNLDDLFFREAGWTRAQRFTSQPSRRSPCERQSCRTGAAVANRLWTRGNSPARQLQRACC
jgi:hypothetical protein